MQLELWLKTLSQSNLCNNREVIMSKCDNSELKQKWTVGDRNIGVILCLFLGPGALMTFLLIYLIEVLGENTKPSKW